HEVVLFHTLDAAELDFPFRHTTLFKGLEGLPEILTDPAGVRDSYLKALHAHIDAIEAGCRRLEIDYVRLRTDADLGHDLAPYLQAPHGRRADVSVAEAGHTPTSSRPARSATPRPPSPARLAPPPHPGVLPCPACPPPPRSLRSR